MAETPLRVLIPQRLDVLARSMDTVISTMWTELGRHLELILWGPGLTGYAPMPLDQAAEHTDCDLVLLPDLHHMTPGLWSELWAGLDRVRRPVVVFMSDPGAAVEARREVLRLARPVAMIGMASSEVYRDYRDLLDRFDAPLITIPLGVDPGLCHPPPDGAERDIDILVSGAESPEAYPVRAAVKRVARTLGERYNVRDLGHPGYWQLTPDEAPPRRGQPLFTHLLRRSRLCVTGTTWGIVSQKYFEAAACGAVGCGDLPGGPEGDPFRGAMVEVTGDTTDEQIADRLVALLEDPHRERALRERGIAAMDGCHLADRAATTAAALRSLVTPRTSRRPRHSPAPEPVLCVVAAPEPESVPAARSDWRDIWNGAEGLSRSRALERSLAAAEEEIVVVALDPDAALPPDALYMAEQLRLAGCGVVTRAARYEPSGDPVAMGWTSFAAPRAALLDTLRGCVGRFGPEVAVLRLMREMGATPLAEPVFDDPAAALMRLHAARAVCTDLPSSDLLALCQEAIVRAVGALGRGRVARELRGFAGAELGIPIAFEVPFVQEAPAVAQDPELGDELPAGSRVVVYEPGGRAVAEAARTHAGPIAIAVPATLGTPVDEAVRDLLDELPSHGLDPDGDVDLVVLPRPLFEAELAWLETRVPATASA